MVAQVVQAAAVAESLANAANPATHLVDVATSNHHSANWGQDEQIRVDDANFHAAVQSSEGVSLEKFRDLTTEHPDDDDVDLITGDTDATAPADANAKIKRASGRALHVPRQGCHKHPP